MINRKILYGYKIQNGELIVQPVEAVTVSRIYTLYLEGISYQRIADLLNQEGILFSQDAPLWNKHKIKRILENPRYAGKDGYPPLVDRSTFQNVQELIHEKTANYVIKDRPAVKLKNKLQCAACGHHLLGLAGRTPREKDTLYLKCPNCGAVIVIPDQNLLAEVQRQTAEHGASPASVPYTPSEEVIRLNNAINRGLENPECPEDVIALILQNISARYDCFSGEAFKQESCRPIPTPDLYQTVSHITITTENVVRVYFKE